MDKITPATIGEIANWVSTFRELDDTSFQNGSDWEFKVLKLFPIGSASGLGQKKSPAK
jgi:hypothetical protein